MVRLSWQKWLDRGRLTVRRNLRWGRAAQLRLILVLLVGGSSLYLAVNLVGMKNIYLETRSLQGIWEGEWQSGRVLKEMVTSGLFQLFVLVLGWSSYFRLRLRELSHLRLRRSEQKYRSIINHAGEAIFLLDHAGRVLEWNKAAESLFRLPRRTVLNQMIQAYLPALPLEQALAEAEINSRQRGYEVHLEGEGSNKLINLTLSRISPGAGPAAEKFSSYVVIARDITSQRQLETRMDETEKLAGIGQLAAGIAHQLNTPLGSILLSAQMLEESIQEEDDVEDVRRIIRQTDQCRGIIKGLLNFARPTGTEKEHLRLVDTIKETTYLMEKNLTVAGVETDIIEQDEGQVYGNRNQLEQVFFNLLANSMDALPRGGKVVITIGSGHPGEIQVDFRDNGEGIGPEHKDRIFLPFFTTKDYGKGTGLGLSIVARIVHEHGGHIEVESEPGRGTNFRLSFPRARDKGRKDAGDWVYPDTHGSS